MCRWVGVPFATAHSASHGGAWRSEREGRVIMTALGSKEEEQQQMAPLSRSVPG